MRATDPQFATNPLPVIEAMARALANLHLSASPSSLQPRTPVDLEHALGCLADGQEPPAPYSRVSAHTLSEILKSSDFPDAPTVPTHGAPTVANAVVEEGEVTFAGDESAGLDPAERDLSIALRSIAETFSPEATRTFLDQYEAAGGALPDGRRLDWYAMVAAFR